MIDAYYVPVEKINEVAWEGDSKAYDLALYNLGQGVDEFIIVNPAFPNFRFDDNVSLPLVNSNRCVVWKYKDTWIAKYFKQDWIAQKKYWEVNWEVNLELIWERNPDIDESIKFDKPSINDLYDLNYEMTWYAGHTYLSSNEKIWVYKCRLSQCDVVGSKDMGYIEPAHLRIIRNPEIPDIEYSTELKVPVYDLKYECVWYLDPKYNPSNDKVWAIKVKLRGANKSIKDMGYVTPKITYNPALPELKITVDNRIPYYELIYEHVWMLDSAIANNVWAAKITPNKSKGVKAAGIAQVDLPKQLDVIFISYNEPNAEENWQRVREKAPKSFRVNGIKGIVNAHKAAAELATTDMFYVVDGDAYLTDDWNFDFQPGIFDRDCVHVWRSRNPVNDLEYGYGGVKLIPRELMLAADESNADMTTSISDKFKVMPQVSNTTVFNTDAYNAWRSAFRECAKLAGGIMRRQLTRESESRLETWCTIGADRPYGEYAIAGACAGRKFGEINQGDLTLLSLINNAEWLQTKFNQQ